MRGRSTRTTFALGMALALSAPGPATADPEAQKTRVDIGREYYIQYCASCHGLGGRGDGPVAGALRDPLPDLTLIAKRRDGVFPEAQMREIIDGRAMIQAHGPTDMPVWGRRLSADVAGGVQQSLEIRSRILLMIEFLKSIQQE